LIDIKSESFGLYNWIFYIHNHFSYFIILTSLVTKTAQNITDRIDIWFQHFGLPKKFQFDNKIEFKNALLLLMQQYDIKIFNNAL